MEKHLDFILTKTNSESNILESIKSELGLTSSKRMLIMIKRIFDDLQRFLSVNELRVMISKLPGSLVPLFSVERHQNYHALSYDHLDQWVESLQNEDRSAPIRIFHSEISILKTLIVIINKLDRQCDLLSSPRFKYSLVKELKEAFV